MRKRGLTERAIIETLRKRFDDRQPLPLGFEDDVAAFPMRTRDLLILKTDMLVASTDVPPGMTLRQAARKAVVAAVSDFAAKGVQPTGLLVSLGLIPPVSQRTVNGIAHGLDEGAHEYGCRIIGGDTSEADDMVIDVAGFGFADTGSILRRDRARPGDVVAVTGDFGKTSAGLRAMLGRGSVARKYRGLIRSVVHPVARLEIGLGLAGTGWVNSSIDSSDGLAWSLHEIARLSKVNIALDKIPIAREAQRFAKEKELSAHDLALYGGEEYELVCTVKRDKFARLNRRFRGLRRIGMVEPGHGSVTAMIGDRLESVEPKGYEHFT